MSQEQASLAALEAIRTLSRRVGIPADLRTLGITEGDIESWIEPALKDPCTPGNPRTLHAAEVRELYLQAL
jgi:alcohol dehydrogenase class IV